MKLDVSHLHKVRITEEIKLILVEVINLSVDCLLILYAMHC